MFTTVELTMGPRWKHLKCPSMDIWRSKMWCIYTIGSYSALKREEILICASTWMNLESIMLSESQT
jgi:hypothetical protein